MQYQFNKWSIFISILFLLFYTGCSQNSPEFTKLQKNESSELLFKAERKKDFLSKNLPKLKKAKAFIIFPEITKLSIAYGFETGDGVLYKIIDGKLSKPIFVSLSSGSIGYSLGYSTRTDLVLIYTNEYLENILDNGVSESDFTSQIGSGSSGSSYGDDGKDYEIISENTGGLIFAADFKTYAINPNNYLNMAFNNKEYVNYSLYHKMSNTVAVSKKQFISIVPNNSFEQKPLLVTKNSSDYNFKLTNNINYDSFALVIGINKYKQNTPVEYADLSALAFKELAIKTLGIPQENIITLLNEDATSGQIKAKLELIKELSDKNGNIYLYYAGHGVPGKDGYTYLLPNDMSADSIYLEPNLKLDNIYKKLSQSNAKNSFVFMDSCFSGKDDNGKLLYKGVAPILKVKKSKITNSKLTILTAGSAKDFANDYGEKKSRLFSYYLIKELSEGKTNLVRVYSAIKNKVKRASLRKGLGYKQVPQFYGNKTIKLY